MLPIARDSSQLAEKRKTGYTSTSFEIVDLDFLYVFLGYMPNCTHFT